MTFKDFYSIQPTKVNVSDFYQSLDEETIASLRVDTDLPRKGRAGPVGSFFEYVSVNWTIEYKSTAVTSEGVNYWTQYIQPVNLPGKNATLVDVREAFNGDVLAHCTCPDYKFRMEYYATQDDWNWGSSQNTPPNITNPAPPKQGPLCKHLVNSMGVIKGSAPSILNKYRKNFL
jgi:hypothetical protein